MNTNTIRNETVEEVRIRQNKELLIRNNPLQLYPESLDALLSRDFPESRWLIESILPASGMTIMSAAPGSFKTWMMLEIALSVAEGRKLFGHYDTHQSGVLFVDEESGPRILQERFKQLGANPELPIIYLSREGHKVDQAYIDSLLSVCMANDLKLVIFDSLVRMHTGDENASKDMSELFNLFKQLADHDLSVLIAHHNRKGIAGSYSPSGDMRGSSDILAAVDCHLALSRQNNSEYVLVQQTKNRYMRELRPFKLRFTADESSSRFQLFEVLETKDDRRESLKEAVIKQLTSEPNPTKKQLLESLDKQGANIKLGALGDILSELKSEGQVDCKPGTRNAVHYFIAEKASASKTQ